MRNAMSAARADGRCGYKVASRSSLETASSFNMDQRHIYYAALPLLLSIFVRTGECDCSRTYTSTQPDCSTARLSDGRFTNTTIPCFAKTETTPIQQLEFPEHK